MPAEPEDNLDSVIADLVDEDESTEQNGTSPLEEMQESADVEFSGPAVQLTERAADQVRHIRKDEDLDDDLCLRVAVEGGGCSGLSYKLGFDFESEEDEIIISQGIKIIVDPKHMMYLKGISVDYPDGLDARGFTFDNPNASETCGCGSSFAT
ncbi:HesB/IscA family protein [Fodinibius sp. SL11]|uniref:HesB/IscA family protein n=1 Tax=Fodinibius sp. SL11 TaxID=3425690 RepID=UPI003F883807